MNILIVSYESWRDTNNGGNVLTNIFDGFENVNIAQIYCSGESPQNSVCQNYYQISDAMLFSSQKGRALEQRDYSKVSQETVIENQIKKKIPSFLNEFVLLSREILWCIFRWKTKELETFILEFKPDVIFAPCYSYFHVSKLALWAKQIAKCPMISYISDDNYSLKRLSFSPSFWINRLITRKWIRRHFAACSLVYTMTEMQKKEYEMLFRKPMKILCKAAEFSKQEKELRYPIKFLYAGGLYLKRWKVLLELAEALKEINQNGVIGELHIYSGSKLSNRIKNKLNNGLHSFLHDPVPYATLMEKYEEAAVAIHAESFDLKNRLITRLSFSTKIIDCLSSGCAVLAIGPDEQGGISYLKNYDAAICITDYKKIRSVIHELVRDPKLILNYAEKARQLGEEKHKKQEIQKSFKKDFYDVVAGDL